MLYMCAHELACAYHALSVCMHKCKRQCVCVCVCVRAHACMHVGRKYVSMAYPLVNVDVS
jgi:hypothetical protein